MKSKIKGCTHHQSKVISKYAEGGPVGAAPMKPRTLMDEFKAYNQAWKSKNFGGRFGRGQWNPMGMFAMMQRGPKKPMQ